MPTLPTNPHSIGDSGHVNDHNLIVTALSSLDSTKAPLASPTFTGQVLVPTGTAGTPAISPTGDTNTGIFSSGADTVNIATGGSERVRVTSAGNVYIGTTGSGVAAVPVVVKATTKDGSGAIFVYNSDGTLKLGIYDDGEFKAQGVYDTTSASAANVWVATNGYLQRSTSSIKYKTDVKDATQAEQDNVIENLRPVTYKSLCSVDDPEARHWGFIAEEVEEIDPRLVSHDVNGLPDGLQYDRIIPALVGYIQRLEARVTQLEKGA